MTNRTSVSHHHGQNKKKYLMLPYEGDGWEEYDMAETGARLDIRLACR